MNDHYSVHSWTPHAGNHFTDTHTCSCFQVWVALGACRPDIASSLCRYLSLSKWTKRLLRTASIPSLLLFVDQRLYLPYLFSAKALAPSLILLPVKPCEGEGSKAETAVQCPPEFAFSSRRPSPSASSLDSSHSAKPFNALFPTSFPQSLQYRLLFPQRSLSLFSQ